MRPSESGHVRGILTLREFDKTSGDLLSEFSDENVVTDRGIEILFSRLTNEGQAGNFLLDTFWLGDDTGTGTLLEPEPAVRSYTSADQADIYTVPSGNMAFNVAGQNRLHASTLLDGQQILDQDFPNEIDVQYCSATLRFLNGETFSYRRFPVRSLSRLIDLQIIWSFEWVSHEDADCPV